VAERALDRWPGRNGGRRPGLRRPLGVRPGGGPRAGADGARRSGPGRAQQPRPVAGRPDPLGRAVATPGGRPRLGPRLSAEAALGWLREHAGLG
jgi:hypothetical protein